jgi:hypothetical protein
MRPFQGVVLTLFCLTVFATSASAECALVLWSRNVWPGEWLPMETSASLQECRE